MITRINPDMNIITRHLTEECLVKASVWKVIEVMGFPVALNWHHGEGGNPHLVASCLRSGRAAIPQLFDDVGNNITKDCVNSSFENEKRIFDNVKKSIAFIFKKNGFEKISREFTRYPAINNVGDFLIEK